MEFGLLLRPLRGPTSSAMRLCWLRSRAGSQNATSRPNVVVGNDGHRLTSTGWRGPSFAPYASMLGRDSPGPRAAACFRLAHIFRAQGNKLLDILTASITD